jgi:DNA ligase-1
VRLPHGSGTPFHTLAELCEALAATTKRTEKAALIAAFLRALPSDEAPQAVPLIIGAIFPESASKALDLGGASLGRLRGVARQATLVEVPLTIPGVRAQFEKIAAAKGPGSRQVKDSLLASLYGQASELEAKWITKNIFGEMQHGVHEGVMLEGIAEAAQLDLELVRGANMFLGDLGRVAEIALAEGRAGLERIGVQLFRPVKPMLAEMANEAAEILAEHGGTTAFEWKFDGARLQIHRRGEEIRIFSRRLTDVTASLPDVVDVVRRNLRVPEFVLEGEAIATGANGRPLPFQDLMRRFTRVHDIAAAVRAVPMRLYLFDLLYLNGESWLRRPNHERWAALKQLCPPELLAPRIVTSNVAEVQRFLRSALAQGHEGLMAKALNSDYSVGRRGKKWFKLKPAETLDVVIVAADWGYGRRTGWLSNYHLAVRDEATGEFAVIGKTFKGLTDVEFAWMTKQLQQVQTGTNGFTVYVRPQIVVEIAYNELQRSPQYRSGFALRFARVTRIREDKTAADIDTLERVHTLYERQFQLKARMV